MKLIVKTMLAFCLLSVTYVQAQTKKVAKPHIATATTAKPIAKPTTEGLLVITEKDFRQQHPEVKNITWQPGGHVTLENNDGTTATYWLDNFEDEKKFRAKYGKTLLMEKK